MHPEERLAELGLQLPDAPKALAAYVPTVRTGNLVFVAGQGPWVAGGPRITGKVDGDVSIDQAKDAARGCALNGLAAIKAEIGDLDALVRMVKLTVFVASSEGFHEQPTVGNGASEFLEAVLGDRGKHARAAVGTAELPFDIPVEIEFIAEVR